jgi:hypothetical protein
MPLILPLVYHGYKLKDYVHSFMYDSVNGFFLF